MAFNDTMQRLVKDYEKLSDSTQAELGKIDRQKQMVIDKYAKQIGNLQSSRDAEIQNTEATRDFILQMLDTQASEVESRLFQLDGPRAPDQTLLEAQSEPPADQGQF